MSRRVAGGITVYFALVFTVITSLIMVLLETSLVYMGRSYYDIVADMAVQSLMGEYYLPLYDEYGILAVDLGFGEKYPDLEKGEEVIKGFVKENLIKEGFTAWRAKDIDVEMKTTRITENNGEAFYREVVENMEYETISSVLDDLKEMLALSKSTEEAVGLLIKKAEVEQSVSVMDELVLELMEIVDGVKIGFWGQLKIRNKFVKKLLPGEASQDSTGINNDIVFKQIASEYQDPMRFLEEVVSEGGDLIELEGEQNRVTIKRDRLQKEISELESIYEDEDELLKKQLIKQQINDRKAIVKEFEKELMKIGSAWTAESRLLQADMEEIKDLVSEVLEQTDEALMVINLLKAKQTLCSEEIKQYIEIVDAVAETLDTKFLKVIIEELEVLRGYAGLGTDEASEVIDFIKMEKTLKANKSILKRVLSLLKEADFVPGISDYEEWKSYIDDAQNEFSDYGFSGVYFDYSGICIEKTEKDNPLSFFETFVRDGLSGLVYEKDMSERVIGTDALISKNVVTTEERDGKETTVMQLLESLKKSAFSEIISDVTDKAVFCGYLNSNFGNFDNEVKDTRVLKYELEYILMGKTADYQNLQDVINRLIALRSLISLVCISCDSEKAGEAEKLATAMVGFSGVPMLVTIMKSAILLVWAFETGLVETAALLKGYYVPLMPDLQSYPVRLTELFVMSKSRIQNKSEVYKNNQRFSGFAYRDYINAFLLFQNKNEQTVRTMDLIQENLRLCYDDEFRFRNCMNAVKVVFDFRTESVFSRIPLVKGRQTEAYGYEIVKKAAY